MGALADRDLIELAQLLVHVPSVSATRRPPSLARDAVGAAPPLERLVLHVLLRQFL